MITVSIVSKLINIYADSYIKPLIRESRDFYEGALWITLFAMGIGGSESYFR